MIPYLLTNDGVIWMTRKALRHFNNFLQQQELGIAAMVVGESQEIKGEILFPVRYGHMEPGEDMCSYCGQPVYTADDNYKSAFCSASQEVEPFCSSPCMEQFLKK